MLNKDYPIHINFDNVFIVGTSKAVEEKAIEDNMEEKPAKVIDGVGLVDKMDWSI
jgi:hypothetical protein